MICGKFPGITTLRRTLHKYFLIHCADRLNIKWKEMMHLERNGKGSGFEMIWFFRCDWRKLLATLLRCSQFVYETVSQME